MPGITDSLNVLRIGHGPVVVLVHGTGGSREDTWSDQLILADHHSLILPDRRASLELCLVALASRNGVEEDAHERVEQPGDSTGSWPALRNYSQALLSELDGLSAPPHIHRHVQPPARPPLPLDLHRRGP